MTASQQIRAHIETHLGDRILSALTPVQRLDRQNLPCGIGEIDLLLSGGFAAGSINELTGTGSSGKTTIAHSLVSTVTNSGNVCAWIDVMNSFDPVSAAANYVELQHMLWVRCGIKSPGVIWQSIDQGIRVTDLLLQAGGFQLIVFDMGDVAAEYATRIPSSTWFRFRAVAEQSRCCVLLLTRHPCARSSAAVSLQLSSTTACGEDTVLSGIQFHAEVSRRRFDADCHTPAGFRKPPQSVRAASWRAASSWVR